MKYHWDITFIVAVQDSEVDLLTDLINLFYSSKIRRDDDDCISWIPTKSKLFEVKFFYRE